MYFAGISLQHIEHDLRPKIDTRVAAICYFSKIRKFENVGNFTTEINKNKEIKREKKHFAMWPLAWLAVWFIRMIVATKKGKILGFAVFLVGNV